MSAHFYKHYSPLPLRPQVLSDRAVLRRHAGRGAGVLGGGRAAHAHHGVLPAAVLLHIAGRQVSAVRPQICE